MVGLVVVHLGLERWEIEKWMTSWKEGMVERRMVVQDLFEVVEEKEKSGAVVLKKCLWSSYHGGRGSRFQGLGL